MKHTARKLLSLLMAFAMICSMIPAALAEGDETDPTTPEAPTYSIKVTPASATATVGVAVPLSAIVTSNSTDGDTSAQTVTWSADNGATLSATTGTSTTVIAKKAGTVTVTASLEGNSGVSATATITFKEAADVPVTGIKLNYETLEMRIGETRQLTATVEPENATNKTVKWSQDNGSVATVDDDGLVTAVSAGEAKISAKVGDILVYCTVNVSATGTIKIDQSDLTLGAGSTRTLTATVSQDAPEGSTVAWSSSDTSVASVDTKTGEVKALKTGKATITATLKDASGNSIASASITVTVQSGLTITPSSTKLSIGKSVELKAEVSVPGAFAEDVVWTSSNDTIAYIYAGDSVGASTTVYASAVGKATITATLKYNGETYTATCAIDVDSSISASASVYSSNGGYSLSDVDDKGGYSVEDQIAEAIETLTNNRASLEYVTFSSVSVSGKGQLDAKVGTKYGANESVSNYSNWLSDVVFTPSTNFTGEVSFGFTAVSTSGGTYPGTITFTVEASVGTDIIYTATLGQNVTLNVDDFEAFWDEFTNGRGSLDSVRIKSVSAGTVGGTLCYGHTASEKKHTSAVNQEFYVNPMRTNQKDLADLTFVPTGTNNKYKSGTVTISFTATGTTRTNSSAVSSTNGTITILYTNGNVDIINYPVTDGYAVLDADDFDEVYRQATGKNTKNPSYTIKLLDLPTYGTLYSNYSVNKRTGVVSGTEITSKNLNSLSFTRTTIEKVAYVPGKSANDTVHYAVYSGGTLLYIGTIEFGGSSAVTVTYSCTSNGVTFSAVNFYSGNATMMTATYLVFGTPSSGTLYTDTAAKTRATTSTKFAYYATTGYQNLNNATYKPVAGYSGLVEIPFTAYNASGAKVATGTVQITVTATTTVTFSDVKSNAWYYTYVTNLASAGIVAGYENGTFRPDNSVTYAEALKLIMMAAGYSDLSVSGGGSTWATGFLTRAQADGLVTGTVNLDAAITRDAFVTIACKALKIQASTAASPFKDSTNGYATALYNTYANGERIIAGSLDNGVIRFRPTSSISRGEVSKIIYLMYSYNGTANNSSRPGWL